MSGLFKSSIARKVAMALSALFLIFFLVMHVSINLISVFSEDTFNMVSHFMGTNPIIQFAMQPILIIGVVFHFVLGFILGGFFPSIGIKLEIFGQMFLNILMLLVVPIVVLSMIVGISRIQNLSQLGSLGSKTLAYYLFRSMLLNKFCGIQISTKIRTITISQKNGGVIS